MMYLLAKGVVYSSMGFGLFASPDKPQKTDWLILYEREMWKLLLVFKLPQ